MEAASTTFLTNIARVNGPTPPGFGEIQPATSATSGCTSPWMPFSFRDTPTSITTEPGLTMSGVKKCPTPTATTTISARNV